MIPGLTRTLKLSNRPDAPSPKVEPRQTAASKARRTGIRKLERYRMPLSAAGSWPVREVSIKI